MTFETIDLRREGPLAVLTLNRPERLNAINARMMEELDQALDRVEADPEARVLLLEGAGRAFCAGFDLKDSVGLKREGVADWRPVLERDLAVIMRFWDLGKPTVAAVQGHAIAGGCELALACDITIAAEGTLLGEPELRFGSGIVALLLPWFTNPKKAKEMLLTGNDKIEAREAEAIGMVNRVVPADQLGQAARALAREMAVMDPDLLRLTKEAINRSYEIMGMKQALRMGLDIDIQIESMETPERKTFNEISRRDGLKAAVAWRESRFDKPDADPGNLED